MNTVQFSLEFWRKDYLYICTKLEYYESQFPIEQFGSIIWAQNNAK